VSRCVTGVPLWRYKVAVITDNDDSGILDLQALCDTEVVVE
jgi:hypothetical protein